MPCLPANAARWVGLSPEGRVGEFGTTHKCHGNPPHALILGQQGKAGRPFPVTGARKRGVLRTDPPPSRERRRAFRRSTLCGSHCRSLPVVAEAMTFPVWSGGKRILLHRGRQPVGHARDEAARSGGLWRSRKDREVDPVSLDTY